MLIKISKPSETGRRMMYECRQGDVNYPEQRGESTSTFRIEVIWSPDDYGYYAEVVNRKTGETLYTTPVLKSEKSVVANAKRWLIKKLGK